MRATAIITASLLLGGCAAQDKPTAMRDQRGLMNAWIVESLDNEAVDNAIVAQRTLFPYHFLSGTPELNNLGVRDLRVLAAHLRRYPGQALNVRRGDATDALYLARLKTVSDALAAEGLPSDAVQVRDSMPGGDGMPARRQDLILHRADKPAFGAGNGAAPGESAGGFGTSASTGSTQPSTQPTNEGNH